MSGIRRVTAFEIFTNPHDLEFRIPEVDGKWAIIITRGPGHRFRMMLSSEPVFPNKKEAVDGVRNTLDLVRQACTQELSDPSSFAAQRMNPDNKSLEEAIVLTAAMQEHIIQDLQEKNASSTYAWVTVEAK